MFRCLWWKIINFVFLTLSDSLFISNHICMFFNHLFILVDRCELLQLLSIFTSTEHSVLFKFVSSASKIHYMELCVFSLPISLMMTEKIYTLSYYHHQIGSMNYYPLFMVRSWNNGMRCMSLYILMNSWYGQIASCDIRVLVVFAPNLALRHRHAALLPC